MPARNVYHDAVCDALIADGWTITHDPLRLLFAGRELMIDLAAEDTTLAAERAGERIAVEVQSFRGASDVRNMQEALGQFMMYKLALATSDPTRRLLMAVDVEVYNDFLTQQFGQAILAGFDIPLVVVDPASRRVVVWPK